MSLRAELVRFCLPWFMRPRFPSNIQIEDVRRRVVRFAHLVPPPPRGTELIHAPLASKPIRPAPARRRLSARLSGAVSRFYLAHCRRRRRAGIVHRLPACARVSVSGGDRGCDGCLSMAHHQVRRATPRGVYRGFVRRRACAREHDASARCGLTFAGRCRRALALDRSRTDRAITHRVPLFRSDGAG